MIVRILIVITVKLEELLTTMIVDPSITMVIEYFSTTYLLTTMIIEFTYDYVSRPIYTYKDRVASVYVEGYEYINLLFRYILFRSPILSYLIFLR